MKDKEYIVYRHVCPNGKIYIGVTKNVKYRWRPSSYKNNNTPFKDAIIEFGWKSIKHEILFSGLTRVEALRLEGELIDKALENGNSLNTNRSGGNSTYNKESSKARSKAFRETNPNYMREWLEAHPNYMREWRKRKKDEGGKQEPLF